MAFAGMFMVFLFFVLVILFVNYVLEAIGLSMIFNKTFANKKWKAWIPIYNQYTLFKNLNIIWNFILNIIIPIACNYLYSITEYSFFLTASSLYLIAMNVRITYLLFNIIYERDEDKTKLVLFCITAIFAYPIVLIILGVKAKPVYNSRISGSVYK